MAIRRITKAVHKVYTKTPHIEHIGFVSLAASEVFHVGSIVLAINVDLLVAGTGAVMYESLGLWKDDQDEV